jgi:hypothetical protein
MSFSGVVEASELGGGEGVADVVQGLDAVEAVGVEVELGAVVGSGELGFIAEGAEASRAGAAGGRVAAGAGGWGRGGRG